ncbi:MAG: CatB-related O-acetyltransferase [Candidatus Wallbacteria bacterium]|nr:CatB-related O-acetyltransferase [Candidatus Wallbacteria bacterium]
MRAPDGTFIEDFRNTTDQPQILQGLIRLQPQARIFRSKFKGPSALAYNSRCGPDVDAGAYFNINENSYIAQTTVGSYCTIGARTAINAFGHPVDWLSVHEFQYHANAFNWVDSYRNFARLPWSLSPGATSKVSVGNDVWTGHNVNVMGGVTIGDGAIIGAGAVVTHDVPAYAIVGGVPAKLIRFRFRDPIIQRLLALKWWEFPFERLSGLAFNDIERCLDQLEEIRAGLERH